MPGVTLDLARLPEALRDHGVRLVETPNWRGRGYGPIELAGQLSHHTAIDGPASDAGAAGIIRGRPDLAGPLANGYGGLAVDGKFTAWLVAGQEAHHAGRGLSQVLRECRAGTHIEQTAVQRGFTSDDDDINGNPYWWGWEWQHPGTHPRWADPLIEGVGRCTAAFAELTGLIPNQHKGHKHWTARKPDPSWPGSLPNLTRSYLEDDMPLSDEDVERIAAAVAPRVQKETREELMAFGRYLFADAGNTVYADNRLGLTAAQGPPITMRDLLARIDALAPQLVGTGGVPVGTFPGTVTITMTPPAA